MAKKTLWQLAIVLTLVTTAFLLVQAGFFAVQGPPPAPPAATPAAVPPAQPVAESPSPAPAANRSGQMKLADKPEAFTPAPAAAVEYSYTLKKQSNERVILPGVTIMSGAKGVSIKTADKDETVQIKRDDTYPTSAYQVMWHKKY
ncbi:MAG: hypothetical protein RIN56_09275 [Sporomusaceae bacterium]|nr:hypothetical protein [Sporomusaceae bacterium]